MMLGLIWALPAVAILIVYWLFDHRRTLPAVGPFTGRASIIVPARNEEKTLPKLLASLPASGAFEYLVVDDASTDRTAEIARKFGATVVEPPPLPPKDWTGKNWACHSGVQAAREDTLVFLDADTEFEKGGLEKILAYAASLPDRRPLSVLPYYESKRPYEELSAFFMIAMALGSGSFVRGPRSGGHLFGQSMFVRTSVYRQAGGHQAVSAKILENFFLSEKFRSLGFAVEGRLGIGALRIRMFPEGFLQLVESWTKAFAVGAGSVAPPILAATIVWMSCLITLPLLLAVALSGWIEFPLGHLAGAYAVVVLHLFWLLRRLGSFSPLTALLYPLPLFFYQLVFFRGLKRLLLKQKVAWKSRSVPSQ